VPGIDADITISRAALAQTNAPSQAPFEAWLDSLHRTVLDSLWQEYEERVLE
jgi:hypothetical protein